MGWVSPGTARRLVWARSALEAAKKRLEDSVESAAEEGMALEVETVVRLKRFVRQAEARYRKWAGQAKREIAGLAVGEPAPPLDRRGLPLFERRTG